MDWSKIDIALRKRKWYRHNQNYPYYNSGLYLEFYDLTFAVWKIEKSNWREYEVTLFEGKVTADLDFWNILETLLTEHGKGYVKPQEINTEQLNLVA